LDFTQGKKTPGYILEIQNNFAMIENI